VKNLLISAGGTATSWHIAKVARKLFHETFKIFICDINESHLVAASSLADKYHKVLPANDDDFHDEILSFLRTEKIDVFIPIVDQEVYTFPTDSQDIIDLGIMVLGVTSKTATILQSKNLMSEYLIKNSISTPKVYSKQDTLIGKDRYIIKPLEGFGSKGIEILNGNTASKYLARNDVLVQEFCDGPEITVDVFNCNGDIRVCCRERLEIKAGVCTKTRIFKDKEIEKLTKRICDVLDMPVAFCFQVMKDKNNDWTVTDLNPRMGAGTALGAACDWSLAAALLAYSSGHQYPCSFLNDINEDKFVVRVYEEIVMEQS
jgi:carbamoyl-phosphate synthase large subunit